MLLFLKTRLGMKRSYHLLIALLLLTFGGHAQCTAFGSSLGTSYVSNNSNKGEMFNLVANNTITVYCFDLNLILGSSGSYEIYYKVGSYVGSESNAAAWTLLGSNANVPSVGFDIPSPMNIPINIVIPAGQTYAFYITATNVAQTAGIRYTNNAGYTNIATDVNLTIAGGIGKAYPFSTNYNNRSFNGTVHYSTGNALPIELAEFFATPVNNQVRLSWKTETELNNDFFTLERSPDGETWETIKTVKAEGNSQTPIHYSALDEQPLWGISYYRLSQTDFNGEKTTYDMRSLYRENSVHAEDQQLVAAPNPTSGKITIEGSEDEIGEIRIVTLLGQDVTSEVSINRFSDYVEMDLSTLENELVIVACGNRSTLVSKY